MPSQIAPILLKSSSVMACCTSGQVLAPSRI